MADRITAADQELDDKGNPITPAGEGGGTPPKIQPKSGEGEAEPEIPVRRSVLQHVIARKNFELKRLRSKEDDDEGDDFEPPDRAGKGDEEDEDALTPEARGAVQKEVLRAIGPVVKSLASKADEDELHDLILQEPEAAKYAKRIQSYMDNPHYRGVPPSVIFHHLAFEAAASSGSRRRTAADLEAGQARGGGRTTRPTGDLTGEVPSVDEQNEMSDEEFEALQNKARAGEFVKEE